MMYKIREHGKLYSLINTDAIELIEAVTYDRDSHGDYIYAVWAGMTSGQRILMFRGPADQCQEFMENITMAISMNDSQKRRLK